MTKNGFDKGIQRYKCASCGKRFKGGKRPKWNELLQEYIEGKQTYAQLAVKYKCSIKTIQRKIDLSKVESQSTFSSIANVLMDTTYFGRHFGVMVFKNGLYGQILFKQYVKQETNKLYLQGIEEIVRRGIKIQSIICDGRKGLFQLFGKDILIQMCNFHQVAIVRRYLTKNPKMRASKDLWEHVLLLKQTDKKNFVAGLISWHNKWKVFLNEQKIDEAGRKRYIHKKLRSAYRSLQTNLPWLFLGLIIRI